jgi:hypothetical protein
MMGKVNKGRGRERVEGRREERGEREREIENFVEPLLSQYLMAHPQFLLEKMRD